MIPFQEKLRRHILIEQFLDKLSAGAGRGEALKVFGTMRLQGKLKKALIERAKHSSYSVAMRIYDALGMETECFEVIKDQVAHGMKGSCGYHNDTRILKDEVEVALPLRVNWGGGWTDTPPTAMSMAERC